MSVTPGCGAQPRTKNGPRIAPGAAFGLTADWTYWVLPAAFRVAAGMGAAAARGITAVVERKNRDAGVVLMKAMTRSWFVPVGAGDPAGRCSGTTCRIAAWMAVGAAPNWRAGVCRLRTSIQ